MSAHFCQIKLDLTGKNLGGHILNHFSRNTLYDSNMSGCLFRAASEEDKTKKVLREKVLESNFWSENWAFLSTNFVILRDGR